MKTHFMVTSEIQDGVRHLIKDNHKCDATGKESGGLEPPSQSVLHEGEAPIRDFRTNTL